MPSLAAVLNWEPCHAESKYTWILHWMPILLVKPLSASGNRKMQVLRATWKMWSQPDEELITTYSTEHFRESIRCGGWQWSRVSGCLYDEVFLWWWWIYAEESLALNSGSGYVRDMFRIRYRREQLHPFNPTWFLPKWISIPNRLGADWFMLQMSFLMSVVPNFLFAGDLSGWEHNPILV